MKKKLLFLVCGFAVVLAGKLPMALAKGGCPTGQELQTRKNESLSKACGLNIRFNLLKFKSDLTSICDSQTSAVDMIEQTLIQLCNQSANELSSKIHEVQVVGWSQKEIKYQILNDTLLAQVSFDEGYVISNWSKEAEKLKSFLRSNTGLSLLSAEEISKAKSQADATKAQQEKKEIAEKKEELKKNKEEKRKRAQEKFEFAKEEFAKKNKAVWAAPGNSPSDMDKKSKEAAQLTQELNQAAENYKKELEEANK